MFNDDSTSCFHRLFSRIFGFILVFKSVAHQTSAINETNAAVATTSKEVEEPGFPFNIPLFPAVGATVTVGALVLLTSVVIVYCKRTKQRDIESGRKRHKEPNEYASHTLKYEENAPHNQAATAAAADDSHRETEDDDDIMDDGHYTRVEIVAGGSKGGAVKNTSAEAKKTADSSDAYALYTKSKKKKVKISNPLYSQVVKNSTNGSKTKDVEDLYTKVSDKKKRKESSKANEDIYTKSNKHQKNGASATTSETDDDLYTKSLKQKPHGASVTSEPADDLYTKSLKQVGATSTSETVDELYTKPRKKRTGRVVKTDAHEMYSKPQKTKKRKRAPFYMNSVKVVQDNELYTDCPN